MTLCIGQSIQSSWENFLMVSFPNPNSSTVCSLGLFVNI